MTGKHTHSRPFPPHVQAQIDQDRAAARRVLDSLISFHRRHTDESGTTAEVATTCLIGKLVAEVGTPALEFALGMAVEKLAER